MPKRKFGTAVKDEDMKDILERANDADNLKAAAEGAEGSVQFKDSWSTKLCNEAMARIGPVALLICTAVAAIDDADFGDDPESVRETLHPCFFEGVFSVVVSDHIFDPEDFSGQDWMSLLPVVYYHWWMACVTRRLGKMYLVWRGAYILGSDSLPKHLPDPATVTNP